MESEEIQRKIEREIMLRGYSNRTAKVYIYHVQKFQKWFKSPLEVARVKNIEDYMLYLLKKKYKQSSVRLVSESLKFYYTQILHKKRFNGIKSMKPNKPYRPMFTSDEALRMIELTKNVKHKLLLMLIYGSGPRVSEVVKIKVRDVDIENNMIIIRAGKGNKGRSIPISKIFVEMFNNFLHYRVSSSDYLFCKGNSHITVRTVQEIVSQAKRRAGIRKSGNCHALRRSFATHMKEFGVDIYDIKEILGHSDIRTTFGYFGNTSKYKNLPSTLEGPNCV